MRRTKIAFGVVVLALLLSASVYADVPQPGSLDPSAVNKYETLLVIPPVMPDMGKQNGATYYEITMKQFKQQILPGGVWVTAAGATQDLPATPVWSYGTGDVALDYIAPMPLTAAGATTYNYPALTVETMQHRRDRVKWINGLVDGDGNYLHHLTSVDQTLHWANPGQAGGGGIDSRPPWDDETPGPYEGPVPMVTHVHGSHVDAVSDGYPEAWWLPAANDIPVGYVTRGTRYDSVQPVGEGAALFEYDNSQRPATLWYHDHTLGMTRNNVYAGPAGFWLVRGLAEFQLNLPGPAPAPGEDPNFDPEVRSKIREIPVGIQDRSFNEDGSLYFPLTRAAFDDYSGPFISDTDVPPIWNPEFFGNFMVVNGTVWPRFDVQPEKYRFRFLDGCNARFLILQLATADSDVDVDSGDWTQVTGGVLKQIGSEGGLFNAPVALDQLLIAPAERADVVIDFAPYAGQTLYLVNVGPDEPFGGGQPGVDFDPADPASTGQVMKFVVANVESADTSSLPSRLSNVIRTPLTKAKQIRKLTLNEEVSTEDFEGPIAALLGILDEEGNSTPLLWMNEITENPQLGTTEIWEIYNFTADAHPIHLHLVMFQVINRQMLAVDDEGVSTQPATLEGDPIQPNSWEMGWKDTVVALPGQVTRLIATFDKPGLFVWHCHIIDHEDNEMMRPFEVVTGKQK